MTQKIGRRWYCDTCQQALHRHKWPDSCSKNQHSVRRICGYSQCLREVGTETACCEEHKVLGYREALHFSAPPITRTSGEWLFRERLRLGLTRSQITEQLKKSGVRVSSSTLAATEVRDRPLPADWLLPLTELKFQQPDPSIEAVVDRAWALHQSPSPAQEPESGEEQQHAVNPPKQSPSPAQEPESSRAQQQVVNDRLMEAESGKKTVDQTPQTPEELLLLSAVQRAKEAAICATIVSTLPTPEVPLAHFVRTFFNCNAAWDLVRKLPLSTFLQAFPHPEELILPDPPSVENQPIASVLPKIVAYHLERETVLALAQSHVPMLTGDFFAGLARSNAWAAIANFPALTFFYAMKHRRLPSRKRNDTTQVMTDQAADGVSNESLHAVSGQLGRA